MNSGTVFTGRNIMMDFESSEKGKGLEEVIYQEEDQAEKSGFGEGYDPEDIQPPEQK